MPPTEKIWKIAPRIDAAIEQNLAHHPALLRQILFNRGHHTAQAASEYLGAQPPHDNDPLRMKDMGVAVERIAYAIQHGETIVVYGDYDADGVTATALLVQAIQALGGQARGYIPDRFEEGYGLNVAALQTLHAQGAALVISVDCGIRSLAEAAEARRLGLDLIITDHHSPGPELPDALAIINTKQAGDEYPEKQLAGVGTAYKLAVALRNRLQPQADALAGLDLVALGTVADMVPLAGENRWLVRQGLELIRRPTRQGLLSLMGAAGVKPAKVSAGDIGYMLGPRLNAAGRMENAKAAYDLLTTDDVFSAGQLAQYLDLRNKERQELTRSMSASAEVLATQGDPEALVLFAFHPEYSSGVVGLAASRLVERFYRPAIVGQQGDVFTRASCRSIPHFHITDALEQCAELFENFGGHAAAAGFTIRNERLPELQERLRAIAAAQLGTLDLRQEITVDAELPLSELRPDVLNQLALLEPTGFGNPQVNLVSRGLQVRSARTVGAEARHLKLSVSDGHIVYDAIAFGMGEWYSRMPKAIDLLYRFEANEFNGRTSLQLNVRDLKPAD
ncbi:MAG: single-stranded-DNA-specific exonuclease RecJ [Anaerolineales bacterium]|jgi:single-stranded-DNA-specific exonuclease|nr:single-stranded-DNA-specific exonuclease RecJ [Anaerolineales bacterium]MCW5887876.1 single-stranded-DNA-specific exonuclease RecJ [Anaerolineales bacterium]